VPELPEVETVRSDVARLYVGDRLRHLELTGPRTVRRHAPELLGRVEGQVLARVGRHGKYLLLEWGDRSLVVVHLRMSGQLLAAEAGAQIVAHTHAVMSFASTAELRFVDPRTFGELFLGTPGAAGRALPRELGHLGPDALDAQPSHLRTVLTGRRAPLKSLLVDQRVLAGIGNIYADEICFDARLRPDRPGGSLRRGELGRLAASARSVLASAIAARGSTLADRRYRDVLGEAGRYQLQHTVYGRSGLPCVVCGRAIERARLGAKSAYFCRACQR
jgi:formamidopyrimidine-DNA glycosylase